MSDPNTLLLITTSYPRWTNGREAAGSFVADLAVELARALPVRVVAPGDTAQVDEITPRLTVYRYAAPRQRLVNLRFWNPRDALRILFTLRAGRATVRHALADGRVMHVLALWALPSGQWARTSCRKTRIPYSVWMLGSDIWALGHLPVVRGILQRVMRDATVRWADGFQLAEDSRRICRMPVGFLPSTRALDTRAPPPPADRSPYRMVFIGRWHRNKGVDLLLDALSMLDDKDWAHIAEVAIYGGGPLRAEVREKAQTLQDARRPLIIDGFIPKAEAERAIVRADWVLIPSRIESIPVIFSDAVKLGRPIIAMPVGDLPAMLNQDPCGMLAEDVDAAAFCRALQQALDTSPRVFADGIAAQAARFDLGAVANVLVSAASGHG